MSGIRYCSLPVLMALLFQGCIKNDIPYPTVIPGIMTIKVEEAVSTGIDAISRSVNAVLPETADICNVRISDAVFTEDMTVCEPSLVGTWDLSSPQKFTLTTYQDYEWTLTATQEIERYFTISGQVGSTVIDAANHRVVVYAVPSVPLHNVTVLSCKLGPAGCSYSEDMLSIHDFRDERTVTVTAFNRNEEWTIYVEHKAASVSITSLDAWTRVAWVKAEGIAGQAMGFRYRKASDAGWTELPHEDVDVDGGSFRACLDGLEPETEYECTAYSGTSESSVYSFTTGPEMQLPNPGFEVFSNDESSKFQSWFDKTDELWSSKWWDSGNVASTTVGESGIICCPDTAEKAEGSASARLNSRYVVVKFAAGNLFSGEFAELVGTSGGIVNFGRPFTQRPRALCFKMKYNCGKVDYVNGYPDGAPVAKGDPDRCQVFIALGDWDYRKFGGTPENPVQVNTTKKETFFDSRSEAVIAYGSHISDSSTDGWTDVRIPLEYTSTSRVPTHIIISCASSMLGDYFTGSSESTLWLDAMHLEY